MNIFYLATEHIIENDLLQIGQILMFHVVSVPHNVEKVIIYCSTFFVTGVPHNVQGGVQANVQLPAVV